MIPGRNTRYVCFTKGSDRCWDPLSPLLNGILVFSYRQQCDRDWMLPTRLNLLPSLWTSGVVFLLLLWPARGQLLSLPLTSYATRIDSNTFTIPYLALPSIPAYGSWFTWYSSATLLTHFCWAFLTINRTIVMRQQCNYYTKALSYIRLYFSYKALAYYSCTLALLHGSCFPVTLCDICSLFLQRFLHP
jgi:hypothetical protein